MNAVRRRLNCWEYRMCGREQGGMMSDTLGVCPAATALKLDGLNGGKAAGRACWMVTDTAGRDCGFGGTGSPNCHECEFYRRVMSEETDKAHGAFHSVTR